MAINIWYPLEIDNLWYEHLLVHKHWFMIDTVVSKYCPPQLEQQCHFTYQHIYKISQQTKEEMRNTAQLSTTEYELQLYVYSTT